MNISYSLKLFEMRKTNSLDKRERPAVFTGKVVKTVTF